MKTLIDIGLIYSTRVSYIDNVFRTNRAGTYTYKEDSIELVTTKEGTNLSTQYTTLTISVVARYYNIVIGLDASSTTDTSPRRETIATARIYILASFR